MSKITSKVALSLAIASLSSSSEAMIYNPGEGFDAVTFSVDEVVEKLNAMLASLEKKSTGEKPMTENQKQNEGFKNDILAFLADGRHSTATEILNGVETFKDTAMTNQRVSAILRQLRLDQKVDREVVKGKTYFFAM